MWRFLAVMFRAVLTVLLVLPMLVSPGMCVCQFVPCGRVRCESPRTTLASIDRSLSSRASCRCAKPCNRAERGSRSHGAVAKQLADLRPAPVPIDHIPGCPASVESTVRKVSLPADAIPTVDLQAVAWVFTPVRTSRQRYSDRLARFPADAPLFVSHCSLLI